MTRTTVSRVVDRVRIKHSDTVHGIEIRRCTTRGMGVFAVWIEENWRLQSGGGIAGNSGAWWLRRISTSGAPQAYGPFTNARTLERSLRRWKRWTEPLSEGSTTDGC